MHNAVTAPPAPTNAPVRAYVPGSPERASLQAQLDAFRVRAPIAIPARIGGARVATGTTSPVVCPHDHGHTLAHLHQCGAEETERAIAAALSARAAWAAMPFDDRAAVFLRAADLLAGPYRDAVNAATMLGQGKTAHQAEIDAACELIDFFRFNVHFARQLYAEQPSSPAGVWNRMQYRPLEGFVLAVTPFNFTSIQGNLPTAPALMGNVVLWKPASTAAYAAHYLCDLLEEAGLPPGVVNMLPADDGAAVGTPALESEHFAGLHFTGSEATFQHLWQQIGQNLPTYRSFPVIVGETGGKDFIVAHPSARPEQVATAIVRGSFEYQGQKCSAASRLYLPESLWPAISGALVEQLGEAKMGPPEDFTNFVGPVIDRAAFDKITSYIDRAREAEGAEVVMGGGYDDAVGYYIEPTVIVVTDPRYETMREELFGPVATVYVYPDADFDADAFDDLLALVDDTSPYALTGAVFAQSRAVIRQAMDRLEGAAGNFYVNDKPTGAVVGQQPFGGARRSGTNDKAGSILNLVRWVSPRAVKETFNPPTHFAYPFLAPDAADETDAAAAMGAEAGDGLGGV